MITISAKNLNARIATTLLISLVLISTSLLSAERRILLLYAFPAEGEKLAQEMKLEKTERILGRKVRLGVLSGKKIALAESGVGMTNAAMTTQRLIDKYNPSKIVFSGIAGAIDTSVHIGDIVICRTWATHDYVYLGSDSMVPQPIGVYAADVDSITRLRYFAGDTMMIRVASEIQISDLKESAIAGRKPRLIVAQVGVSGNAFIDNLDKRIWLQNKFGAYVTDMESAAVAQVCTANGIPFIIFRSSSDLAGGSGSGTASDEIDQFFQVAADNSAALVMRFLSNL